MLVVGTLALVLVDVPFSMLTVFAVVRNQYFYLDEAVLATFPEALSFVVTTYVIVEVSAPGREAITYGILTTANNIGGPVATAVSGILFSFWSPALADVRNYVVDAPSFRAEVALSVMVGYLAMLTAFVFLPLLPDQKADTAARLATRPHARRYAVYTAVIIVVGLGFAITCEILSIFPTTSCLRIAGGQGCSKPSGFTTSLLPVPPPNTTTNATREHPLTPQVCER